MLSFAIPCNSVLYKACANLRANANTESHHRKPSISSPCAERLCTENNFTDTNNANTEFPTQEGAPGTLKATWRMPEKTAAGDVRKKSIKKNSYDEVHD